MSGPLRTAVFVALRKAAKQLASLFLEGLRAR